MQRLAIFLCVLVLSTAVLCEDPPNSKSDHHPSDHHPSDHHPSDHHSMEQRQNEHQDHHNEQHVRQNDHQKPPGPAASGKMPEMPKMPDSKLPSLNS